MEREAFNESKTYPSAPIPSRDNFLSYPLIAESSLLTKADPPLLPPISASASTIIEALDSIVEFITSLEFRRMYLYSVSKLISHFFLFVCLFVFFNAALIEVFARAILPAMITCSNRLALAARDVPQANDIGFLCIFF